MAERNPNELGALWLKTTTGGKEYMTGTIAGQRVVCFRNKNKSGKQPDWRVLKSVPKEETQQNQTRSEAADDF